MYLWKYWRDTRRGVFVYLGVLVWVMLFWLYGLHRADRIHKIGGDALILWSMMVGVTFAFVYLCAIVMGFVTAGSNVGADFAKGTAEFLLTRPRPRRSFVWAGWAAGIVELYGLMAITGLLVMGATAFAVGPVWRKLPSPFRFQVDPEVMDVPKMMVAVALTAALVFGLTYFMSVLLKSSQRGVIGSLGIFVGYLGVNAILKVLWGYSLPTVEGIAHTNSAALGSSPLFAITGWALLSLAFPFAAQAVLDRVDV